MSNAQRVFMHLEALQGPILTGISFAALAGSAAPAADAGNHRLVWPLTGSLEVHTDRSASVVRSPSAMWIPAERRSRIRSERGIGMASFAADSCFEGWNRLTRLTLDETVPSLLAHLHRYADRPWAPHVASAVVEHLGDAFALADPALPLPADPRARQVSEALIDNPADRRDLVDFARQVGASESNLRRVFRAQTGMSFRSWRQLLRMQVAMRQLEVGAPVGRVAVAVGYGSAETFARAFRSHTGLTPTDYRSRRAAMEGQPPIRSLGQGIRPLRPDRPIDGLGTVPAGPLVEGGPGVHTVTRRAMVVAALILIAAACGDGDEEAGRSDASSVAEGSSTVADDGNEADPEGAEASADSAGTPEGTRIIVDGLGNEVEVPAAPLRVAAMDLFTATRLLELGVHPIISGVPDPSWENAEENLDAWESMGFDSGQLVHETLPFGGDFSVESIAAAEPDLIIGQPAFISDAVDQFSAIAPVVQWDSGVLPIAQQLEVVAGLVGKESTAAELVQAFDSRVATLAETIGVDSIAMIDNNNYDGQFYVYGEGGGITNDWAARLGVQVIAPDVELDSTGGAYISTENIPALADADAVVVFSEPLYGEPMLEDTLFLTLEAVESGRLCDAGNYDLAIGTHGLDAYASLLEEVADCLSGLSSG